MEQNNLTDSIVEPIQIESSKQISLNNLKEVELYIYMNKILLLNQDQFINGYDQDSVINMLDLEYYSGDLDYYLEDIESDYNDFLNKFLKIFYSENLGGAFYDLLYDLIGTYAGHYILYDISEFYDQINKKVHYKTNQGYEGAYYYFDNFNININSDSYLFIDHNNKKVLNLDSLNYQDLKKLCYELFKLILKDMNPEHLKELYNLMDEGSCGYIVTNSYNNRLKLFNKDPELMDKFLNYDQYIYVNLNYLNKSKTIKESDLIDYIDLDYLVNMFINEEEDLIEFIEQYIL